MKGSETIAAMWAFQRKHNLSIEWRISHKMMSMLSDEYQKMRQIKK
jgi:hypothetical protein